MRRVLLASLPVLLAVACGGDDDGGGSSPAPDDVVVVVEDNTFEPREVTVAVGDTVTWRFEGANAHNVVADDFESERMRDGTFEQTFDEAGEFSYECTLHAGMKGTVIVSEDSGAAP